MCLKIKNISFNNYFRPAGLMIVTVFTLVVRLKEVHLPESRMTQVDAQKKYRESEKGKNAKIRYNQGKGKETSALYYERNKEEIKKRALKRYHDKATPAPNSQNTIVALLVAGANTG